MSKELQKNIEDEQCPSNYSESLAGKTEKQTIFSEELNGKSSIKKVIGVVSGKGGVGKSLVTSILAVIMRKKGI